MPQPARADRERERLSKSSESKSRSSQREFQSHGQPRDSSFFCFDAVSVSPAVYDAECFSQAAVGARLPVPVSQLRLGEPMCVSTQPLVGRGVAVAFAPAHPQLLLPNQITSRSKCPDKNSRPCRPTCVHILAAASGLCALFSFFLTAHPFFSPCLL